VTAQVLIAWGGLESAEFERQSCTFADLLQIQGARVERQALPGAHHMSVLAGWRDPDSVLCRWMAQAMA
jgi:arylformamidase